MTALAKAKSVGYPFKGKPETIQVVWDFAADGGTAGALSALTILNNLLVTKCHAVVKTTCTGTGATVRLGVSGNTDKLLPEMDVADLTVNTVIAPVNQLPQFWSANDVAIMTIGSANLTAGKIEFTFEVMKP